MCDRDDIRFNFYGTPIRSKNENKNRYSIHTHTHTHTDSLKIRMVRMAKKTRIKKMENRRKIFICISWRIGMYRTLFA